MSNFDVVIIGGGFTGLSAAYELALAGKRVCVLESEPEVGGLAGTFEIIPGIRLEKFYHHWFNSDTGAINLCHELGLGNKLRAKSSNTGLYYANSRFRLSSPLDLLKLSAIPFVDRIRTGLMVLAARRIKDWRQLEGQSAEEWIIKHGGKKAFEIIWRPLLQGKFGSEAPNISAVWFWNKLKLRGGSRNEKGAEELLYLEGGFEALLTALCSYIKAKGSEIRTATKVEKVIIKDGRVSGVMTTDGLVVEAPKVLSTVHLPQFLQICPELPQKYRAKLAAIRYLGNICLVLRLKRRLSDTYWLNVADPSFPFVGVIEHTNFDRPEGFPQNESIAFISKYLAPSDDLFRMNDAEYFEFCIPHIKKIFPAFSADWVAGYSLWRANYSQPVIVKNYSKMIPELQTPVDGLFLASMAQIYPEDRGTSYAIDSGRNAARQIID